MGRLVGDVRSSLTCLKGDKSLGLLCSCQLGHVGNGALLTDRQTDNTTYRAFLGQLKKLRKSQLEF